MKLSEKDAKAYIKDQLKFWLEQRGIDPSKPFRCLHPTHRDTHASMSYYNGRVKCFACGYSGDLFDLIGLETNLTGRALFLKVYKDYGIELNDRHDKWSLSAENHFLQAKKKPFTETKEVSFAEYLSECAQRVDQTDYFIRRGLSQEVIQRFGLGYDPNFHRGTRMPWKAAIIPNNGYYISRNTDPAADDANRYRKAGKACVFNAQTIYDDTQAPVWIVEGEFDALSIETAGSRACALGSVSNADQLIRMLENKRPICRLIVAMDADKAGNTCKEKLTEAFHRMQIEHLTAPADVFMGYKDANEALIADPTAFARGLRIVEGSFDTISMEVEQAEADAYMAKYSAFSQLDAFLGEMTVDTPCIQTGFSTLNEALDGGLYPSSLVVLGAVSSAGKTTFALQMADFIAGHGTDVLIFSLEMSARELMAKSLSRLTLKKTLEKGMNPLTLAKSSRDITVAARYQCYSDEELLLIDEAIQEYCETSKNVFIVEGAGNLGVGQIRTHVEEHVRRRKCTPVVFVDYLQLLQPSEGERLTEKQSTDKNVMELRRIARDFSCPVIAISSFSRANYHVSATMSAYKESGGIEYSSDVLMAIQYARVGEHGFDLQAAMQQNPRQLELLILKNRTGETGKKLSLRFYPKYNYFDDN